MAKIFFAFDKQSANKLSAEVKKGRLKRIYHGIYSSELEKSDAEIVQENWIDIIYFIIPRGILSYRSALELRLISYEKHKKIVFMTSTYNKTINLPGLTIKINKGEINSFIEQFHPNLARSNESRTFLENLSNVRSLKGIKTVDIENIEERLAKILHNRSEIGLNKLRDEAKEVAKNLNLSIQYKKLNEIISSLLSTHVENNMLTSPYAKAVIRNEPYDFSRIKLFTDLSLYLQKCDFIERTYEYKKTSFKNLSFFESYFSNYIEGTKFIIDEAEDIVFSGKTIGNRHADSHDVLANFRISNDYLDISKTPTSANDFINLLQSRHAMLMSERIDISPGEFKKIDNKAGNAFFVRSQDVIGTLMQAYNIYSSLKDGMQKALFIHFVITEVHPFNDGNGRISRIMLNSELVKSQQYKIIIPNVYRDSYMASLRAVTRDSYFLAYSKTMDVAQAYTASIPWNNYSEAREKIEVDRADREEDEGLPIFNRALRKLVLTKFMNNSS